MGLTVLPQKGPVKPTNGRRTSAELEPSRADPYHAVRLDSEGKRIGQRSDSKSDAPKGVVGSNPMPSAVPNRGR
jgi:hypothetical protein